jgi:hypothetical protein
MSPVDTGIARALAGKHAVLIEMVSQFQFQYGRDYRLKPGSPTLAWSLYQEILNQQVAIARLLDAPARENPVFHVQRWWKFQDVMDIGIAFCLGAEINHLLASCACRLAAPEQELSPVIATSQAIIAGMLHPSVLLMAQGQTTSVATAL